MAFNDIENKRIEKAVAAFLALRRPPPEIRDQVDLGWQIDAQSMLLFETRPVFDDPSRKIEHPVVKTCGRFSGCART